MINRRTVVVLGAVIAIAAAGALLMAILRSASPTAAGSTEIAKANGEAPPALARHLEELGQAIPGNGGESSEGPGGAEAAELAALAYPDSDIPLARLETERLAAKAVKARGFPSGRGKPGTWVSIGPKNALYPFFDMRDLSLYVPNAYLAASRINDIAISPSCRAGHCRMWIAPAGGGIWRTENALADEPAWKYLSSSFEINAMGSIALDPTDPTGNTIWVGTGEGNTCGSGCVHGQGLYKSTDGGDTWTGPYGKSVFGGRGVSSIAVDPRDANVVYASSTFALHGMSSVCCSGITRIVIPGAKMWGVYKSTNGGSTWTYIHGGSANAADCATADPAVVAANTTPCTPRGVRQVVLDPSNPDIVYSTSYARGVWRSNDGGATWTQIKPSLNSAITTTLPWIAVTTLPNGNTRAYVGEGHTGAGGQYSRVFRSDDVATGTPVWSDLTSADPADTRWGTFNFCTGQCWYDNIVYTPKGNPDIVYVGGSYLYGEPYANHRGLVLSTDAGQTWYDQTADGTDSVHPNALHPDQHAIVTNPTNPYQFFEGNDGGVMRSSGAFADVSSWCDSRGLNATRLARCHQMLSQVPTLLTGLNKGLTTLQFQSLSVNPFHSNELQGGTQDNGTWQNEGSPSEWHNTMVGDGGQSGFDVSDPSFRFHTYFDKQMDVNFSNGATEDWNWNSDPFFLIAGEASEFYVPTIADPKVSKTLFLGAQYVWRTKTAGVGSMTLAEFRQHCNEWTGDFTVVCGDWVPLGSTRLTNAAFGDRAGGTVVAVERASSDTSTLWAATSTGRVFVSQNANADPASSVSFTRIDSLDPNDPNRFVSSIYIDPANANHAWVSYTGFSSATPTTPGHVFEVTYNPVAGTATWTSLDGVSGGPLGDIPVTDLLRDDVTGDLYAGTDYGVMRLAGGSSTWTLAAPGMPNAEVAGLTIVPSARKLYAATHGLAAWSLNLP
ncbi:MAG TPA: sialidase family protein [Gaiellaceae bacterium]